MSPPLPFDPIAEAQRQWAKHWGTGAVLSMGAVTSIMRSQQILITRLNRMLKPFDLTFPRYEALMLLYYSRSGSLPLGKMGDRLQVHRTSVTNIIDGLERSRYVRREPHQHDRRKTLGSITSQGRDVASASTRILNEARFGTEPLRESELEATMATLERLRAAEDDFGGNG